MCTCYVCVTALEQAVNASSGGVVVYARRWVCNTPHVVQRRTTRLRLPDYLAYRPDPVNNPHTLTASNARSQHHYYVLDTALLEWVSELILPQTVLYYKCKKRFRKN